MTTRSLLLLLLLLLLFLYCSHGIRIGGNNRITVFFVLDLGITAAADDAAADDVVVAVVVASDEAFVNSSL